LAHLVEELNQAEGLRRDTSLARLPSEGFIDASVFDHDLTELLVAVQAVQHRVGEWSLLHLLDKLKSDDIVDSLHLLIQLANRHELRF